MAELFAQRSKRAEQVGASYELLWNNIQDVALVGGKRIRPLLTAIGYGSFDEKILPIATAQELIHIAVLMHDDIIDQDFFRHNALNMNGLYKERYKAFLPGQQAAHYANSAALLAGDLLIAESYQLICSADINAAARSKVLLQLTNSIYEVVGGELLDVEAAFVQGEVFDPLKIYRYKTASYSFIGPLLSGGYAAELDESTVSMLRAFAENIGIAFQMQDDILGIFGDTEKTGKSTTTDLREAKWTSLIACHKKRISNNAVMQQHFRAFGSADASDEALECLAKDIKASGAYEETMQHIAQLFNAALESLSQLPDGDRRTALLELLEQLRGRER